MAPIRPLVPGTMRGRTCEQKFHDAIEVGKLRAGVLIKSARARRIAGKLRPNPGGFDAGPGTELGQNFGPFDPFGPTSNGLGVVSTTVFHRSSRDAVSETLERRSNRAYGTRTSIHKRDNPGQQGGIIAKKRAMHGKRQAERDGGKEATREVNEKKERN